MIPEVIAAADKKEDDIIQLVARSAGCAENDSETPSEKITRPLSTVINALVLIGIRRGKDHIRDLISRWNDAAEAIVVGNTSSIELDTFRAISTPGSIEALGIGSPRPSPPSSKIASLFLSELLGPFFKTDVAAATPTASALLDWSAQMQAEKLLIGLQNQPEIGASASPALPVVELLKRESPTLLSSLVKCARCAVRIGGWTELRQQYPTATDRHGGRVDDDVARVELQPLLHPPSTVLYDSANHEIRGWKSKALPSIPTGSGLVHEGFVAGLLAVMRRPGDLGSDGSTGDSNVDVGKLTFFSCGRTQPDPRAAKVAPSRLSASSEPWTAAGPLASLQREAGGVFEADDAGVAGDAVEAAGAVATNDARTADDAGAVDRAGALASVISKQSSAAPAAVTADTVPGDVDHSLVEAPAEAAYGVSSSSVAVEHPRCTTLLTPSGLVPAQVVTGPSKPLDALVNRLHASAALSKSSPGTSADSETSPPAHDAGGAKRAAWAAVAAASPPSSGMDSAPTKIKQAAPTSIAVLPALAPQLQATTRSVATHSRGGDPGRNGGRRAAGEGRSSAPSAGTQSGAGDKGATVLGRGLATGAAAAVGATKVPSPDAPTPSKVLETPVQAAPPSSSPASSAPVPTAPADQVKGKNVKGRGHHPRA